MDGFACQRHQEGFLLLSNALLMFIHRSIFPIHSPYTHMQPTLSPFTSERVFTESTRLAFYNSVSITARFLLLPARSVYLFVHTALFRPFFLPHTQPFSPDRKSVV